MELSMFHCRKIQPFTRKILVFSFIIDILWDLNLYFIPLIYIFKEYKPLRNSILAKYFISLSHLYSLLFYRRRLSFFKFYNKSNTVSVPSCMKAFLYKETKIFSLLVFISCCYSGFCSHLWIQLQIYPD